MLSTARSEQGGKKFSSMRKEK